MGAELQKVMLVGEVALCRAALKDVYELIPADVEQAESVLRDHRDDIALVVVTADAAGMTLLQDMNQYHWIDDVPVVACILGGGDIDELCRLQVADVLNGEPPAVIRRRVDNVIRLFAKQRRLLALMLDQERVQGVKAQQLRYLDDVTGCLNYDGFRERVNMLLQEQPSNHYALWYCDIKNFKYINESFGYEVGNQLLRFWSETILYELREDEAFGRLSGDTMLLLTRFWDMEQFAKRFHNIARRIDTYLQQPGRKFRVQMAAGVYLLQLGDLNNVTIEQMMDRANVAQKSVKRLDGSRFAVFNEEYWGEKLRDLEITQHLDEALANGEISVWYQPQYDYTHEQIIGAEALCRWEHGNIGSLRPSVFIPVLERSGQIVRLDRFVWEQVCKDMARWKEDGLLGDIDLSVNISRTDLEELDSLGDILTELLERYGLGDRKLRLEITESAYMSEPERLASHVKALRDRGFLVEMDDFGSGFSSLNMLKDVPVDLLKLDMRFLYGRGEEQRGGMILGSVIRMAGELSLPIIAEGVETLEQANLLKNMGCNLMQGFYFARPMPADEFADLLEMQNSGSIRQSDRALNADRMEELLDANSNSAFIFDSCIGAAMLLEYDGTVVEATLINDAAFELFAVPRHRIESCRSDLLSVLREDARLPFERAIRKAISVGSVRVDLYNTFSERWMELRLFSVASLHRRNVLLVLLDDADEAHRIRAEMEKIQRSMESYMTLLPGGVFRYEADGAQEFTYVSETVLEMLGYTPEQFRQKFHNRFPEMVWHEDRERVLQEIDTQITRSDTDYCEYRIEKADGSLIWVYDRGRCITDESGKRTFYVIIADVNDQKHHIRAHEWQDEKYKMLAQIPGTVTYDYDPAEDRLTVEVTMDDGTLMARTIEHLLSSDEPVVWMPDDSRKRTQEAFRRALTKPGRGDVDLKIRSTRTGVSHWYRAIFRSLPDENNKVYRIVGRADDFDEVFRDRLNWQNRALRDSMTGLLNHEAIKKVVAGAIRDADGGAMLMIDIDNFKVVNDTLGHLRGDSVLKRVARLLRDIFREGDILGRYGGDEFVVFMPGLLDLQEAIRYAQRLQKAINDLTITGAELITCSIGIGIADSDTAPFRAVMERADIACYHAKDNGKARYAVYDRSMHIGRKLQNRHTPTDSYGSGANS